MKDPISKWANDAQKKENMENNQLMNILRSEAVYEYTNHIYIDNLTNEIMDYLRNQFKINPQSDKDDMVYSQIWMTINMNNLKIKEQIKTK